MLDQNLLKMTLREIVTKIIASKISIDEINERIKDDLETNDVWENESLLITDCYYALKHIQEENISIKEWRYFLECFNNSRQYNLEDKKYFILSD